MKIERAESKFQPVVITLESQEEVDALSDIVALAANHSTSPVHGTKAWHAKEFYRCAHSQLEHHVTDDCNLIYLNTPDCLIPFQ